MRALVPAVIAVVLLAGCDDTGRSAIELPFHGAGLEDDAPFDAPGGWTIDLDRADVGFGPAWLCTTEVASPELCDTALLELRETVAIDALSTEPRMLGTMRGVTGEVRSAMFDYGISWIPTANEPRANEGAPESHSAIFEGRASHPDGRGFAFRAAIDLVPVMQGAIVINGRRFEPHALAADDASIVRVDVRSWWRRVDLDRMAARGEDPVVLAPGDPDYEALVIGMTAGEQPSFEWGRE